MIVDTNTAFGGREQAQRFPIETLLTELERIPCAVAFVGCRQGSTDALTANNQTLAACANFEWMRPVCAIHPRDSYSWQAEIDRCLAAGARLFRISPREGGWPPDSVFLEAIVEKLAGTGAVLSIDASSPGLPSQVVSVRGGASVPLLFTEARYYPLSELLLLAGRHPDIYIETGRITSPEGIERAVEMVGAERLLFGSGAPRYSPWVAWQTLERAAITPQDRERIAWENADRLFDLNLHSTSESESVGPIVDNHTIPVIDIHLHDRLRGGPVPLYDPQAYASHLADHGVVAGVCSSATGIFYDLRQGNDEVASMLTQIPQVSGYVVVDPRYPDDSQRELERLAQNDRFVGVKIHAAHSATNTNSREMRELFERIAPYRKPVLIHNLGADWPEALVELAGEHPDLPIIAAHAGYGDAPHPTHDAAIRLAPAPNILIEFCSTYLAVGAIQRGLDAVGPARLLFGSDFPLISLPYMLTCYAEVGLDAETAEQVYWKNAVGLFPSLARWVIDERSAGAV